MRLDELTVSQRNVISHKGKDLLISAGAGSGKTSTLITGIVEKIKNGADISRILLVTFTKAAANELKGKVVKELSDMLSVDPENAHISDQIVKVASADISTIDSFCIKIVRPNFDKLSIDSDFRIGDSGEIEILRKEAMEEVIDSFYERNEADKDFLTVCECFSDIGNEGVLGEELLSLHNSLISTPDSIKTLLRNTSFENDFSDTVYGKVIVGYLTDMLEHYLAVYDDMLSQMSVDEDCISTCYPIFKSDRDMIFEAIAFIKGGAKYESVCESVANISFLRMKKPKSSALDTDAFVKLRDDFKSELSKVKKKYFSSSEGAIESAFEQNNKICRKIYDILEEFESVFSRKKRLFGVCDFNDIERFALKLLYDENGEKSEIARQIAEKYDEIYIDEYQDTNSVQDKIFSAISRNNRYMVGDVKQSIYRFRSAEPEIFSSYRSTFTPVDEDDGSACGNAIFMSENFRCDKTVIDFSNLVSDHMFKNSGAIPYSDEERLIFSKRVAPDYTPMPCEVCIIDKERIDEIDDDDDERVDKEADFVAREIKELLDNGYLPNGEKIKMSHIAILIRNFKRHAPRFTSALEAYGIRAEYTDDVSFFEKSEVLLALSVLNVIDNPTRDIYLAAAMRSEVFGFSLEELVDIRKASSSQLSFYSALKEYSDDKKIEGKISEFLEKIKKYREMCRKKNSCEMLAYIYSDTGLISMCNKEERKSLLKLYDLARRYEAKSYKGVYSFLRYVEKISKQDTLSAEKISKSKDFVTVSTIHGSKGLEYEICFVVNANGQFSRKDTEKAILYHRELGIAGYVRRDGGIAKFDNLLRKSLALAIKCSSAEEEMRLLYVAMTRARCKLYITGTLKDAQKKLEMCRKNAKNVSKYSVTSSSSYFDFVLPCCAVPKSCFDLRIISDDGTEKRPCQNENNDKIYNESEKERVLTLLKERFDFKYPYEYLERIPSKMSISKLYPLILDGNENEEIDMSSSLDFEPRFLEKAQKTYTGAEKGTATHVFMQFCNFENLRKNGVDAELAALVKRSFISDETAKLVNKAHIEAFVKSELFSELLLSKRIIREFRFNIMLPAREFSSDELVREESVLVQGVTDCIYENKNSELVLVDYKTDSVTLENYEKVLKERHSTQLSYYKRACEMIFERPLSKALIYSVPLAKTIEI
ncbi:MAG: UvrD-helicase domain-containing protein [Clostridia bacterium]|nr:UvrD-helicase domain-containing protein [Clostridia bacterium]